MDGSGGSGTKRIVVTGSQGFVGRNLLLRLSELPRFEVVPLSRSSSDEDWRAAMGSADAVIHLAGVNRPSGSDQFADNPRLSQQVVSLLSNGGRSVPVIYASSIRAEDDTAYGLSKKEAEDALLRYGEATGASVAVNRLPNVFGKWARPNYNSAVATFCHNIARDLPINYEDPAAPLNLLYIDDLMEAWIGLLDQGMRAGFRTGFQTVEPVYRNRVGDVAAAIRGFRDDRPLNRIADVGEGLTRALYATYISYLPVEEFGYPIQSHRDPRGAFSEMLKTRTSGQFSYFNALPGVTRGGHYHHTKTEKFLIVHGEALFRFRNMSTGETHELRTSHESPVVVQTIPGWAHDVTNIGNDIMVSLLWANEIFDADRPDTVPARMN